MEHVVFFPAQDGSPAFRRLSTLDEAVRLVEHLRNVEGVSQVSCHALTEVPLAFKAYYRVEVPSAEAPAEAAPVPVLEQAPEPAAPVLVAPDVLPELVPDVLPEAAPEPLVDASLVLEPPAVVVPEQPVAEVVPAPVEEQAAPAGVSSLGFFSR